MQSLSLLANGLEKLEKRVQEKEEQLDRLTQLTTKEILSRDDVLKLVRNDSVLRNYMISIIDDKITTTNKIIQKRIDQELADKKEPENIKKEEE